MRPLASAILALLLILPAMAADLPELQFEKYTLPNGLDVILHEDHSVPMVGVNVWYHVGSKNEKPGRTGFAHLFEHMMFQGSENHDTDYFMPLQKTGGRVNGSTTEDRTNYWENVPANQLELALWLEADRMGFLIPAMTQEKFDNQQSVVKNEKRQGENRPYSRAYSLVQELLFPEEHPYSHTVIGSMEDLSAASLEDVQDFFRLYYAPNNASLCVTGDFDPDEAKALIEKYFGTIPPGMPVERLEGWQPRIHEVRRAVVEDRVELPRLFMEWHAPAMYSEGEAELDLISEILTSGKTSRLYQSLVYEKAIAQDLWSYVDSRELCSTFNITVTAAPGHGIEELEAAVDAELSRLLAEGVSKDELEQAQTSYETGFIRRLQRMGGFGGKADLLNNYNTFLGDPGMLAWDLQRYSDVTRESLMAAAKEWLTLDARAIIHIVPQGSLGQAAVAVDRSGMPAGAAEREFNPPEIQTAELSNGLTIYLVEKHDLPLVQMDLSVASGWSSDPADRPGCASLTAELMDEGAGGRDALEIASEARGLGVRLGTGSDFDRLSVSMNVLKKKLPEAMDLFADIALKPSFPEEELERQRQIYLGRIQQEKTQPRATAMKTLQKAVYGEGHPYAQPYTGTGTETSIKALSRQDLVDFHKKHLVPANASLLIVGDIDMKEARKLVEKKLGKWKGAEPERAAVPEASPQWPSARIILVDKPGAQQSMIACGKIGLARGDADYLPLRIFDRALGGSFISRINMNLREDKGYTYGAYSQLNALRDGGGWGVVTGVDTPNTEESVSEILKEMTEIHDLRPPGGQELDECRMSISRGFPQNFETYFGITRELDDIVRNGLPLDHWKHYQDTVETCDDVCVRDVGARWLKPEDVIFVIVGDRAVIEEPLRALELGEIKVLDSTSL